MSVLNSKFNKRLCCEHKWKLSERMGNVFEHCTLCGATCVRCDGQIVEYDRVAGYGVRQQSESVFANIEQVPDCLNNQFVDLLGDETEDETEDEEYDTRRKRRRRHMAYNDM